MLEGQTMRVYIEKDELYAHDMPTSWGIFNDSLHCYIIHWGMITPQAAHRPPHARIERMDNGSS